MRINHRTFWMLLGAVLFAAGCASVPLPREQLAISQAVIDNAKGAGVAQYAPVELAAAQDKLSKAKLAVREGQYVAARRLAEEAEADAQLAQNRALAMKSNRSAQQVEEANRALHWEINRNDAQFLPSAP
ncbi:DUF4398 domain-containing protein [Chitinimonas sp. PSY-7]|uniref:DUF4398 domain-containing protein n=1 Tax=Chitinimonas sp. PSY-7 TaxID=3459088 RepID=UPI0040402D71